jgi:hypothetical protein
VKPRGPMVARVKSLAPKVSELAFGRKPATGHSWQTR